MNAFEIREKIDQVLEEVDFDPCKDLIEFSEKVFKKIKKAIPDAKVDAFNRIKDFVIQVSVENIKVEVAVPL